MKQGDVIMQKPFEDRVEHKIKEKDEKAILSNLMRFYDRNKFQWLEFITPLSVLTLTRKYQVLVLTFVDFVHTVESYVS
jgi:hypothetical protein